MPAGPWIYTNVSGIGGRQFSESIRNESKCTYCHARLVALGTTTRRIEYVVQISAAQRELARRAGEPIPDEIGEVSRESEEFIEVTRCPICGWWVAWSPYPNTGGHIIEEFGYGQLRALDPQDIGEPVESIRSFLATQYSRRLEVHPKKFEEVVCSVFADIGYCARLTSYSGDGGIDVFLDGPCDSLIGVQVKRSGNAIEVEQINALTGALVVNDCTAGIFVTTSRYRRGAIQVAEKASVRGFPIELYDADRLYDALLIAQTQHEVRVDDPDAPWMKCAFQCEFKVH